MQFPVSIVLLLGATSVVGAAERSIPVADEVVVTATRFSDRYIDTPVNMTVISAEDIRRSSARTVADVLAEQAGISIHDFFGNNAATTAVDLRGFGITGAQNTLILLDGRRITDIDLSGVQWSAMPLNAVERIEIMRGSGAVLYGDGATTGVINIITRSPSSIGNSALLHGGGGAYDTREAQLLANYFTGSLGINVFAGNYVSDGYRDNNRNRQSNLQAELKLITGGGDVSLKLGNDNQGLRLPGARRVQPSAGVNELETDRRGAQTPLDWGQRVGNRATLDWRHETAIGEFSLGAGYRDKEQTSYFDQSGFPDFRIAELEVWSLSPRMRFPQRIFGAANTLVAGADWYRWDYRLRLSDAPSNIVQPFNTVDAVQETFALYVHNTTRVSPLLTLVAGARIERYRIRANDAFDPSAPGGAFGSGAPPGSRRDTEPAWELAARYQLRPKWAATARLGRSYRFANVDEIYEFSRFFTREFQFLRPQTAKSAEMGVERRSATGFLRAALFTMDVEDEIHLDIYSTGVGNTNLPPSRRRGLEIEGRSSLGERLSVGAAYTLTEAEFREGVLPGGPFTAMDVVVAGRRVPLVPRHKVNLNASWAIGARTRLNALFTYVGSQYMDNDEGNTGTRIPSYAVFDLKLGHQARNWRLSASINNLFNEKYYNYAVRSQFVPDRYNAYPLPERNAMLTLEYALR